ncbi:MAG TPA: DUF5678 domain-containing protein [Anaerolineae bacterium]
MNKQTSLRRIDTTLYLDRWVAVVRERVVGVGLTAEQAFRAAKRTRPKDKPWLFYIDAEGHAKETDTV